MTVETCQKLYEHFKSIGDDEKAQVYAERIKKKGGEVKEPEAEESTSKRGRPKKGA